MSIDRSPTDGPRLGISHVTVVPTNFDPASEVGDSQSSTADSDGPAE